MVDDVQELLARCAALSDALAERSQQLAEQTALRRGAEQEMARALRQVELRETALQTAEQLAQVGSWSWDVGANAVEWSVQVHRIFGTDPAGVAPDFAKYVAMVHPEEREQVLELVRSAALAGESYEVEHRIVRGDGLVRHVLSRGKPSSARTAARFG